MNFIDFFSGIGGFRLGMERAGHECVGHCEIDKFADRSYRAMHEVKNGEWFADDISKVDPRELPEADCWCFGFPCQAFSISGKRKGFRDPRGNLFFEVMRLAEVRQPSILFAENVKGLLNHEGGATFRTIITTMVELGYCVEWELLDSKNFGIPQHRERVFIVGHLGNGRGKTVFPIRKDTEEDHVLQGQEILLWGGIGEMKSNDGRQHYQQDRIYHTKGICPTLTKKLSATTNIISNTLRARITADSVGVYPTSNGGVLKVNSFRKE